MIFLLVAPPRCVTRVWPTGQPVQATQNIPMVLARVSLLLRWSCPRPLGARVAVIDGSRGNCSTAISSSRSSTSKKRQFVEGRALCSSSSPSSSDACADVDVDESLREYMATLGVFFTLPEQGVTTPEILTRCDEGGIVGGGVESV